MALAGLLQPVTNGKANFTMGVGMHDSAKVIALGAGYKVNDISVRAGFLPASKVFLQMQLLALSGNI